MYFNVLKCVNNHMEIEHETKYLERYQVTCSFCSLTYLCFHFLTGVCTKNIPFVN